MSEKNMEEAQKENADFSKKSGEVLNMALGVETNLEFFISNYFIRPQSGKIFFFNDVFMIKYNFERKVQVFKEICKREKFDEKRVLEIIQSINFIKETRNKVAHWQGEKMFDKPLRLRNRISETTEKDILELNDELIKKLDEERLKAIHGINEFYMKYYREGTIDERNGFEGVAV